VDLPFTWMFVMFASVHLCLRDHTSMAIWNIWQPVYWLDAGIKAVTATVSRGHCLVTLAVDAEGPLAASPGRLEQANRESTRRLPSAGASSRSSRNWMSNSSGVAQLSCKPRTIAPTD
jgi:hypothetical protein